MRNIPVVRSLWWQIGLTVLPGLLVLCFIHTALPDPLDEVLRLFGLAVTILLGAVSILPAILHRNLLDVQAYGLVSLGVLVGIAATLGLWPITGTLDLYLIGFIVLVAVSLVFARRYCLGAGLFVLVGGFFAASVVIEPGMYMGDSPVARLVTGDGVFALFWILTPIAVLRARSIAGQLLGLVLPMAIYIAVFVYTLSSISGLAQPIFNLSVSQSISIARPYIVLGVTVVLAMPLHVGIYTGHLRLGMAPHDADNQHRS
jgi:hypothetical protein